MTKDKAIAVGQVGVLVDVDLARRAVDAFRERAPKDPAVRRAWLVLAAAVSR